MGFSCSIYQGEKSLTGDDTISYKLFGLAPSNSSDTDAPYRVDNLRYIICSYHYADRLPEAAQDCFRALQAALRANLESLKKCHCETCSCPDEEPIGWSVEAIKKVLAIDPKTITEITGGY